jgi:hypothetical protein
MGGGVWVQSCVFIPSLSGLNPVMKLLRDGAQSGNYQSAGQTNGMQRVPLSQTHGVLKSGLNASVMYAYLTVRTSKHSRSSCEGIEVRGWRSVCVPVARKVGAHVVDYNHEHIEGLRCRRR